MQGTFFFITLLIPLYQGAFLKRQKRELLANPPEETCSPLKNHVSFSSVKVSIGTPPQAFQLVADTGSNDLIVVDCTCRDCPRDWGSCFTGPKRSTSFDMTVYKNGNTSRTANFARKDKEQQGPLAMVISFGSGQVAAEIASDEVRVGSTHSYMKNGLLLLVDHSLNLPGPFEGILGLGRPQPKEEMTSARGVAVPGFFEAARVQRFSMCFNRMEDGVLGVHTPQQPTMLKSVGKVHWGLDFRGITVGKNLAIKAAFCDASQKPAGMETVCGLIPDSGTTLITGPTSMLITLFEEICQNWPRCRAAHEELKKEVKEMPEMRLEGLSLLGRPKSEAAPDEIIRIMNKIRDIMEKADKASAAYPTGPPREQVSSGPMMSDTLQLLLESCASWIEGVDLNDEMPKLTFHVAGANGVETDLVLPPRTYVLSEQSVDGRKVCIPAFSPNEMKTTLNGDVWIMGTPLFYEYTAHYDRGLGNQEASMAFTPNADEACGQCKDDVIVKKSSLITSSARRTGFEGLQFLTQKPVMRNLTNLESI
ncbi:unnamed protein product [Effrenium voratum]|nr:unnamed protein product [Effrenium voratum]